MSKEDEALDVLKKIAGVYSPDYGVPEKPEDWRKRLAVNFLEEYHGIPKA